MALFALTAWCGAAFAADGGVRSAEQQLLTWVTLAEYAAVGAAKPELLATTSGRALCRAARAVWWLNGQAPQLAHLPKNLRERLHSGCGPPHPRTERSAAWLPPPGVQVRNGELLDRGYAVATLAASLAALAHYDRAAGLRWAGVLAVVQPRAACAEIPEARLAKLRAMTAQSAVANAQVVLETLGVAAAKAEMFACQVASLLAAEVTSKDAAAQAGARGAPGGAPMVHDGKARTDARTALAALEAWATVRPELMTAQVHRLYTIALLRARRYPEALRSLTVLRHQDPSYRGIYLAVQRVFSVNQRGQGKVSLRGL